MSLFSRCANWLIERTLRREPDFVVHPQPDGDSYLNRWWLIPRNPLLNVYLHEFRRSDDDRALHDHPWPNCSVLLVGEYVEHTVLAGGIRVETRRRAGDVVFRRARTAHRIQLMTRRIVRTSPDGKTTWVRKELPCFTLFLTGPRLRSWGFHCERRGWVPWREFTDPATDGATTGKGCDA